MSKKILFSVKSLNKSFLDNQILKDVNIDILEGNIVGIVGRNGSGKTVLLKIIARLYFPDSGLIKYDKSINERDFGYLIDTGFLDNETGFNNLVILAQINNVINKYDIYNVMKFVGLDPLLKTKYKNYSTGMKQKLKFAQAIMENPKVLILDEPFNGLDKNTVMEFRNILRDFKNKNKTIIITSHYQEDIDNLCDIVYEMNDGVLKLYEKN